MEFMKKITANGIVEATKEEKELIESKLNNHSKDLHYLAFDRQLSGFSPLDTWLGENEEIRANENEIIESVIARREVCSLYPKENLTIFPFETSESGNNYNLILSNLEKDFADILELNDKTYKTECMVVDFGHGPNNLKENYDLIIGYLQKLLDKSKKLENLYILNI